MRNKAGNFPSDPEQRVLALIELIYASAEDTSAWSVFLESLGEFLQASSVCITTGARIEAYTGIDPDELATYAEHYAEMNPWLGDGRSPFPEDQVLVTEEVMPVATYRQTGFYNEWAKKNSIAHGLGGAIRVHDNAMLFLSLNRGDSQDAFGEPERHVVQLLMPHLRRAAALDGRLAQMEEQQWMLDALSFPVIHVASDRRILWANQAGEKLLNQGNALFVRAGKIHARVRTANLKLDAMLRAGSHGGWLRSGELEDSEFSCFLAPAPVRLRPMLGPTRQQSGFLLFVATVPIDGRLETRLREAWGLTTAEARLAVALLESDNLQMAADRLQISRNTAKTQLSSLFQAAGVRRQSELVRRMLTVAAINPGNGHRQT
jgi:DNA-binding CsgD family transcriptional regulator/PAS domain-containing protein